MNLENDDARNEDPLSSHRDDSVRQHDLPVDLFDDLLQAFRQDIRKHIRDIADKYLIPGETADGAVMFLPAEAIFAEDDVPEGQEHFIELNAELTADWPVINVSKDPPPDAAEWDGVEGKLQYLER